MKKSVQEQARQYVQGVETKGLERLAKRIKHLEAIARKHEQKAKNKRDGGCGCHQCRKKHTLALEKVEQAKAEYQDEFNRMYVGDLQ